MSRPRRRGILAVVTASLHFTHGPAFSVVEVTALAFLEDAEPAIREISDHTRRHGTRRLLVNLVDVVGTFDAEQQRAIGLLAFHHLGHLEKVASLVPPDKITRLSEASARAQGMELRVFTELSEAVEWLVH
jgi:hypothetical protein